MKNKWYINPVMTAIKRRMKNKMELATEVVKSTAMNYAPIDTGNLKQSFTDDIRERGDEIVGRVSNTAEYAAYVEFGTGEHAENGKGKSEGWVYKHPKYGFIFTTGMKPQPFLRPALLDNEDRILSILKGI